MAIYHIPVLLNETIQGLNIQKGKKYIDATLGGGGHSEAILKEGGLLLAIDCDEEAISFAQKRLISVYSQDSFRLVKDNFIKIAEIAHKNNFYPVSGILFDLGVSSYQLETANRGFSFNKEARLDMRMDQELKVSALDLINALSENELRLLFEKFGEEFHSRSIARAIIRSRQIRPITTTNELAQIVIKAVGKRSRGDRSHPATRVFQALRIAVNDELNNLKSALSEAAKLLEKKGRLAVISFHSLEDRIVKNFFKEKEKSSEFTILTMKPITPNKEEIIENVRSRSAKLRILENKTRIKD